MGSLNDDIETQLGMPYGTACNRLRRLLFFQMAQLLGRDACYKCGLAIKEATELSIDHIQPWRGADPWLFWDLENIAFSHHKCNRPDRPRLSKSLGRPKVSGRPRIKDCIVCGIQAMRSGFCSQHYKEAEAKRFRQRYKEFRDKGLNAHGKALARR